MVTRLERAVGLAGLMMVLAVAHTAFAGPVDDKLVIDDVDITTQAKAPEGLPFDHVYSGWRYRNDETRAMEADSFENPGALTVERGEELWSEVSGSMGKSCASCHGEASESMKGVGASYPKWDPETKRPIDIELRIDQCRKERMGAEPFKFNSEEQVALTAYVKHQSLGMPVKLDLAEGDMQSWWDHGKELYYTRTGQLNLACASCHEQNAGNHIRADHLSQGQVNGFPLYRLKNGMASVQARFRGCIRDTRAEMPEAFSDDMMALETYVTWRGAGLSVETPAVRN